jgi:hypothetical protein
MSPLRASSLGALLLLGLAAGCTGSAPSADPTPGEVSSGPTAAARLDLSGIPVPRVPLCDVVPEHTVVGALGQEVAGTAHYDSGEEVEVAPGVVDVAHEHGCVYEGADGTVARVWVFARPVGDPEATALVRRARRGRDCSFPDPLDFGTPGLTSLCEVPGDDAAPVNRARLEGLFSDTWVGCEVTEPAPSRTTGPDVVQRAVTWCAAVVNAAGSRS